MIELAASIEAFGFVGKIVISEAGEILDGGALVKAALRLGLPTVPCIVVDHLSPAKQKAFRISVNRLGEQGAWDIDNLKIAIGELFEIDEPVLGFSDEQIDLLLLDDGAADPAEAHEAVEIAEGPGVSRLGDAWSLGDHRVLCADACDPTAYDALFGDDQARTVLTDPPYNVPIQGPANAD